MDATVCYHLGRSGASEEFVRAVEAGNPHGTINQPASYARSSVSAYGTVPRPSGEALRALWAGDVEAAYAAANTNLAIVLEEAFSDAELGIVAPTNPHNYQIA